MKLLYLTEDNLRSTPFIKDLVYNFKNVGKSIILHDHFGSVADTRFVTKRISALMSEEMVTNNAFSGDMRSIFRLLPEGVHVRKEFLVNALQTVDLLVLNPLCLAGTEVRPLEATVVATALRKAFGLPAIHLFAKNSRSPIVASPKHITQIAELDSMRPVYEEESTVLDAAQSMLPVILAAPGNFLKAGT